MHLRHVTIPMDVVRTVVAVSESGSLTKAADRLGLSQPAVSSQIKRIESIVGGSVFTKTASGSAATPLGKLILHQARRILDAHDQMLRFGGSEHPDVIRVGLSSLFVRPFIKTQTADSLAKVHLQVDHSTAIAKGLIDGYIDIACIFENPDISNDIDQFLIDKYDEQLVWVRSKDFVLSPGSPIPVLGWPGDDWMIRALTKSGKSFRIVMSSSDYHGKEAAVEAGIGLTAVPSRMVPPSLMVAKEYYLPPLPTFKALLYLRPDVEPRLVEGVQRDLSNLFFKQAK